MTQIRIGVASGIFLYSIQYIKERNILKFTLCILIATLFHYTAIIAFPLFFLRHDKLSARSYFVGFIICFLFFFLKVSLIDILINFGGGNLSSKIYGYKALAELDDVKNTNIFNVFSISNILLNLVLLWKNKLLANKNKYFILLIKINCISFFISCIFYDFSILSFRLSEYLGIVSICLYPMLIYLFKPKYFGAMLLSVYALLLILVNLY